MLGWFLSAWDGGCRLGRLELMLVCALLRLWFVSILLFMGFGNSRVDGRAGEEVEEKRNVPREVNKAFTPA